MKTPKLLLSAFALCAASSVFAAVVPSHDAYVIRFDEGQSEEFVDYFKAWDENNPQPMSEDENFYIGRVPLKKRFENKNTQVDPTMTTDRKFCMWTPMGISDTYWQSLPRYVFDGDNFSMWSYIDSQGGWSLPWVRVPGAYSDVTHRNGVANGGGLIFFDSWGGDNTQPSAIVRLITTRSGANKFKYTEKFVKFLRYYGLDGVGVNPEGQVPNAALLQDFFSACREYAESIGWQFHVYWYGTNTNTGYMDLGSTLVSSKQDWFFKNGKQVTDMYMLNYNWSSSLGESVALAESLGADPYNIYAGYDIQGKWLGYGPWSTLKNHKASIVLWGNHTTNMIYQNSSEFGSGDEAVQACYLTKQEQVFSGGYRNPANRPAINNNVTASSEKAMEKFHGIAEFLPARSVLQELPFVTRFGLGNGKSFYNEGKVTFANKWFNVGVQDYLPTWRWWIVDDNNQVPNDGINCGFTHDDAWFAGSAMHMSGATQVSNVRLFKTKFDVAGTDDISLTYKVNKGDASCMKLFWSFEGSESQLHYAAIEGAKKGEWVTFAAKANEIGMEGKVALIGLRFENTPVDYDVYIGEFGIIPATSFAPVKPEIISNEDNILKKRTYQGIDFKFSWKCAAPADHPSHADKSHPIYNEDVDTWYFEVYVQAKGEEAQLCGTTSSWAHYVVNAPVSENLENVQYRVGVCAVAPDGKTKSEITWTNYLEQEITLVDGIGRDKDVIKSNDEFTLSILDPNQLEPASWSIINATTAAEVKQQAGGRTFTTSLPDEGYYDVVVTKTDGNKNYYRAFIQVSAVSTGKVPSIESINTSSTEVDLTVSDEVTLSYVGDKGEGTVSRGLELLDPYMFRIPQEFLLKDVNTYSVGMWIKPSKFSYAQFGMSLINQRNYDIKWPDNNWGAFWVDVWPEKYDSNGNKIMDPNIVSFTMFANEAKYSFNGNSNKHEIPNLACCSDGNLNGVPSYCFVANVWSHILISYDGSKQRIYFNGKKVGENTVPKNSYIDTNGSRQEREGNIYIGGSRVYYAGFNGEIDDVQVWHKALSDAEVQDAMNGYWGREIPSELKGYWTFEDVDYDAETKTFTNRGTLQTDAKAAYLEVQGSGGENTTGSTEILLPANINVTGNPAMSGTLPITTKATFEVDNATVVNSGDEATAKFSQNGKYDVTLTLANGWGSTTMTNAEFIVVKGGVGIEDNVVENLSVYPNPFVDQVNLLFATDGNYKVEMYDAQGRLVISKDHQAMVGEIFTLQVNAEKGTYYIVVSEDGKRLNSFKVIAQ